MKKFLLACAALAAFSMSAADITESFKTLKNWGDFPGSKANATPEVATIVSPETGIEYTYSNACGSTYLMLVNTKDALGYIEFKLDQDCGLFVIKTTNSISEKDDNAVNFYANGELLNENPFKVNVKNQEFTFVIPADAQAAGTVYKIEGTKAGVNNQFESITYGEPTTESTLVVTNPATGVVEFALVLGEEETLTISGVATNIDGDITIVADDSMFEIGADSCTAAEFAEGIEVSFKGVAAGEYNGNVKFLADDLEVEVALHAVVAGHEGTETDPLTVSDVLLLNNLKKGPYFVTGTIAGCAANVKEETCPDGVTDDFTDTNFALSEEGVEVAIAVVVPNNDIRTAWGLASNPDKVGKTVVVSGTLESYFGRPGVKNTKSIIEVTPTGVEGVAVSANTPAEYYNLQGVRVAQPTNGIYLVRQNGKVSKVLVK